MTRRGALLLPLALAACGFQPLYGEHGAASPELAAVRVELIPERIGQELRTALQIGFQSSEAGAVRPRYSLAVRLVERRIDTAARKDATASRADLYMDAVYDLRSLPDNKSVAQGTTRVATGFNIVQNDFATVAAENNARERAIREMALAIQTRVALFFDTRRAAS